MTRVAALAAVGAVVLALSACGGSRESNASKISRAKASEASAEQIHATLQQALSLHSYAGVSDSFTIPPGGPDVFAGQAGEECDIDLIEAGSDAVNTYSGDDSALVSPDHNAVVKVGGFEDTPESDCLQATRQALGW